MSKGSPAAIRRAVNKYNSTHTKQVILRLNLKTDADILAQLAQQPSVQGYIKELIRQDIAGK